MERKLVSGMYYNAPSEKAPDWVLGRVSFNAMKFMAWLEAQTPNEKGYINTQILMSKKGEPYVALDDYKKPEAQGRSDAGREYAERKNAPIDFDDDPPF